MSKVYFTADLHLGHKNIHKFRTQFSSAEEHDAIVYENILRTVTKRDTLWILGDAAFTKDSLAKIKALPCNVNLVLGNHDVNERGIVITNLAGVYNKIASLIRYKNCWLSHCPIHPQEFRGRRANIHGHLHSKLVEENYGQKYVNVCLEHWDYKPVEWSVLEELL